MAKGAFLTSREIFSSSIWSDVIELRLFMFIYGNAVFAEDGIEVAGIHLKRGQFLRSYRNLRDDLQYTENKAFKKYPLSTIKTKIDKLVKEKRLAIEATEYGTLFTVLNYAVYQSFEHYEGGNVERHLNSIRTANVQSPNNNKNVKNVKKEHSGAAEKIPYAEIVEYLNEKTGKHFTKSAAATKSKINARWHEGRRLADFKTVIDVKSAEWNGTDAAKWLRPETLFGTKFEAYLNEQPTGKPAAQQESKSERIKRLQKFVADQHANGSTPDEIQIMVAEIGANLSIEKINKIIEIGDDDLGA